MACLCWQGVHAYRYIHRLVASAFISNPDNLPEVNHINGDKTDNLVENLEWVTRSENHLHATRTGLRGRGEKASGAKLNRDQAIAIRALAATGQYTFAELGSQFGVNAATVGNLIRGETWGHLGPPIDARKRRRGSAKITEAQAIRIRSLYSTGKYTMAQVGEQFGLKKSQVGNIVNGRCW